MAVFRVQKTEDYTVMSNYHLRDKGLSLKAKGLLSQMLSLPEDWDYTLAGLSYINKESKDAIRSAVKELETAGYVIRHQTIDGSGKFSTNEYIIYERPVAVPPLSIPSSGAPSSENPPTGKPSSENPTQLNTKKSNTEKQNTDGQNTDSLPIPSIPSNAQRASSETKRKETMSPESMEIYREMILENIEYDLLKKQVGPYTEDLDEIAELMVETVCSNRESIRVAGSDFPHEVVKSRLLKLNSEHISFVMQCMRENTTKIRNMKQYLLTALFNAPTTISNYYTSLVNHDLYGGTN